MLAIITVGCSASGKSTWADKQKGFKVLSRDDFRRECAKVVYGDEIYKMNLWSVWKFNKETENEITRQIRVMIQMYAHSNQNIIIADTNLNKDRNRELEHFLTKLDYEVEYKYFPIGYDTAVERDEMRRDTVGHKVIAKQLDQYAKLRFE